MIPLYTDDKFSFEYVDFPFKETVAAFQRMHVSPVKHSYVLLPRKCDYQTDRHAGQSYSYVPLCFAGDTKTNQHYSFVLEKMCIGENLPYIYKLAYHARQQAVKPDTTWAAAGENLPYMYKLAYHARQQAVKPETTWAAAGENLPYMYKLAYHARQQAVKPDTTWATAGENLPYIYIQTGIPC